MAQNNEKFKGDLKHYFSEAYALEYDTYSKLVESALDNLISSEIINYKYSNVLVIGRKGISLFEPYIQKINGKNNHQGIFTIKLFSYSEHPLVQRLYPRRLSNYRLVNTLIHKYVEYFGNTIVLTDAINSGNEITEVLENLNLNRIPKVCGYLANREGLSKLQKKYPYIQFSFSKITDNENYYIEQDRLQLVYQSRLTPIDGEHPYRVYSLKYQISTEDLILHISNVIDKFKLDGTELKKDEIIVPHIVSYSVNLDFDRVAQEKPELKQKLYEIERCQMRFKIDPTRSHLRIMALALALLDGSRLIKGQQYEYAKCGMDALERMCDRIIPPEPLKDEPQEKICPLCIDNNISDFIVSYVEIELFKALELIGVKIEKMEI